MMLNVGGGKKPRTSLILLLGRCDVASPLYTVLVGGRIRQNYGSMQSTNWSGHQLPLQRHVEMIKRFNNVLPPSEEKDEITPKVKGTFSRQNTLTLQKVYHIFQRLIYISTTTEMLTKIIRNKNTNQSDMSYHYTISKYNPIHHIYNRSNSCRNKCSSNTSLMPQRTDLILMQNILEDTRFKIVDSTVLYHRSNPNCTIGDKMTSLVRRLLRVRNVCTNHQIKSRVSTSSTAKVESNAYVSDIWLPLHCDPPRWRIRTGAHISLQLH